MFIHTEQRKNQKKITLYLVFLRQTSDVEEGQLFVKMGGTNFAQCAQLPTSTSSRVHRLLYGNQMNRQLCSLHPPKAMCYTLPAD